MPSPGRSSIRLDSSNANASWNFPISFSERILWCDSHTLVVQLIDNGKVIRDWTDPFAALLWMSQSINPSQRWIGYISYEFGKTLRTVLTKLRQTIRSSAVRIIRINHSKRIANKTISSKRPTAPIQLFKIRIRTRRHARAIDYIRAGDVFQINLSQRFSAGLKTQPDQLYNHLREKFPAQYGACLIYDDFALLSNSPELFLRVTPDRKITTRPIKGTRPLLSGDGRAASRQRERSGRAEHDCRS